MTGDVALLEREVYTEAEASRLLGVSQSTLHYWLEGGHKGSRQYLPIIRQDATRSRIVTWGEFVEAALLHEYRTSKVPMVQLRLLIQTLRADLGVPYPLAHARPWISGRDLLWPAQEAAELEPDFWLVANDQGVLSATGEAFRRRVTWGGSDQAAGTGDWAMGYHPQADSPVVIDPRVRFGRPSIKGVSTEAIASEVRAGATYEEAAADFGVGLADVAFAYDFEDANRAA